MLHSEELDEVLSESCIKYCPEAVLAPEDIMNIDFDTSQDNINTNIFKGNVISDLSLRGYDEGDLYHNFQADSRKKLLKSCLKVSREIRMIRNALTIKTKARITQFVEVDHAIPCIMHSREDSQHVTHSWS